MEGAQAKLALQEVAALLSLARNQGVMYMAIPGVISFQLGATPVEFPVPSPSGLTDEESMANVVQKEARRVKNPLLDHPKLGV